MPPCAIINCLNSTKKVGTVNQDISYHRFPKNPIMKKKWIEATGRKMWFPTKHSRICSIHFHEDSFTGSSKYRRVINTAYPTIDVVIMSNNVKVFFLDICVTADLCTNFDGIFNMHRNLRHSERKKIIELHRVGRNMTQIADELDIARATVRRWVDRFMTEGTLVDRHRPQPPRAVQSPQLEKMLQTLKEYPSTSLRVFAKEFNCSVKTIRRHLDKERKPMKENAQTKVDRRAPSENNDEESEGDTGSTIIIKEEVDEDIVKEEIDPIEQLAMKRRQDEEMAGSSKKMRMEAGPENFLTPPEIVVQPFSLDATKVDKEIEAREACLLPEFFMSKMLSNQTEIISILKNQVLLQDPDPALLTFLRFVGAKLQRVNEKERQKLQDKITDLLV